MNIMENKITIKNIFITLGCILFLIYLLLFILINNGLYTYTIENNKNLTEEKMKLFEEDIKNGKEIDLENYVSAKSNSNKMSEIGSKLSNKISKTVKNSIYKFFNLINKLMETS